MGETPQQLPPVELDHQQDAQGRHTYRIADSTLTLERLPSGWRYQRDGMRPIHLPEGRGEVRIAHRVPSGEALGLFEDAAFVSPEGVRLIWIAWPLDVVVLDSTGAHEIDQLSPRFRKTLFGVGAGSRILPACRVFVAASPRRAITRAPGSIALAIELENRSPEPVAVSRVPIDCDALGLGISEDGAPMSGLVRVTIESPQRASARVDSAWMGGEGGRPLFLSGLDGAAVRFVP